MLRYRTFDITWVLNLCNICLAIFIKQFYYEKDDSSSKFVLDTILVIDLLQA